MEISKERSKKSWKSSTTIDQSEYFNIFEKFGKTHFTGYENLKQLSKIIKILNYSNSQDILFFDQTPFYGESGGQVGDTGTINNNIQITDVIKPIPELHGHIVKSGHGLKEGDSVNLSVDSENRDNIAKNHSATHLLQSALIEVLGVHVRQAGSLVNAEKLRFDFTHTSSLSSDEINSIESIVNKQINNHLEVTPSIMSKDEAINSGAMAIFGEKYDDEVRVLKMGEFSTELCGGTHVSNTNEISIFKITSESSLSSGVRRIEAITSTSAFNYLNDCSKLVSQIQENLNTSSNDLLKKIEQLKADLKSSRKENAELKDHIQSLKSKDMFNNAIEVGPEHVFYEIPVGNDVDMRKLSDDFATNKPSSTGLIYCQRADKVQFLLRTDKKFKHIDAGKILKENISILNGRGGGKPHMAQGSGDFNSFREFKDKVIESLKRMTTNA